MEKGEVLDFVRSMKPTDHVIMFYLQPEDKYHVLFTYLKAGLDRGEAAAYVASQESPAQIKRAMRRFGIDVDKFQKSGALHIIDYRKWYIIKGTFSIPGTMKRWKKLLDESTAKGFKGLRVAGEMAAFFKRRLVRRLVGYEQALHRVLELPLTAICAYDTSIVMREGRGKLLLELVKAHSTVIYTGEELGLVKSY